MKTRQTVWTEFNIIGWELGLSGGQEGKVKDNENKKRFHNRI